MKMVALRKLLWKMCLNTIEYIERLNKVNNSYKYTHSKCISATKNLLLVTNNSFSNISHSSEYFFFYEFF